MSVKHGVLSNLGEFAKLSVELLSAVCELAEGRPVQGDTPEEIMKHIVVVDSKLQASVQELAKHQRFQREIIQLQDKIRERDREILKLAALLHSAEQQLEKVTGGLRSLTNAVKTAQENPVDIDQLIEYGYRITYSTGRLPGMREFSPFPPDAAIQSSRLMSELVAAPGENLATAMGVVDDHDQDHMFISAFAAAPAHANPIHAPLEAKVGMFAIEEAEDDHIPEALQVFAAPPAVQPPPETIESLGGFGLSDSEDEE